MDIPTATGWVNWELRRGSAGAELPNAWDISAPHRLRMPGATGRSSWTVITQNGNGKVPGLNVCSSPAHRDILYRSIYRVYMFTMTLFWRVPCMYLWAAVHLPTLWRVWLLFRHFFTSRRHLLNTEGNRNSWSTIMYLHTYTYTHTCIYIYIYT